MPAAAAAAAAPTTTVVEAGSATHSVVPPTVADTVTMRDVRAGETPAARAVQHALERTDSPLHNVVPQPPRTITNMPLPSYMTLGVLGAAHGKPSPSPPPAAATSGPVEVPAVPGGDASVPDTQTLLTPAADGKEGSGAAAGAAAVGGLPATASAEQIDVVVDKEPVVDSADASSADFYYSA